MLLGKLLGIADSCMLPGFYEGFVQSIPEGITLGLILVFPEGILLGIDEGKAFW